jgi:hypothetical protein
MNRDICEIWDVLPECAFGTTSKALDDIAQKWLITFALAITDQAPRRGSQVTNKYEWCIDPETTYEERKAFIEKYTKGCEKNVTKEKTAKEVAIVDAVEGEDGEKQSGVISEAVLGAYDRNYESIDKTVTMLQVTKRYEQWSEAIEVLNDKNLSFLIAIVYVGLEGGVDNMKTEAVKTLRSLFEEYKGQDLKEVIEDMISAPDGLEYIMKKANMAC